MGSPISAPEDHGHNQSPGPGESSGSVQPGQSVCTWDALGKSMTALRRAQLASGKPGPLLVTAGLSSPLNCLFFLLLLSFTPTFSFSFLLLFKWGNGCYCPASVKRFSFYFKFWRVFPQRHTLF